MKKILVTVFQVAVTIALLYWVYHDPNRRAQMAEALRHARYSWVVIGILAYVIVARSAKGPRHSSEFLAPVGLVLDRDVLQPVSAGWNRW